MQSVEETGLSTERIEFGTGLLDRLQRARSQGAEATVEADALVAVEFEAPFEVVFEAPVATKLEPEPDAHAPETSPLLVASQLGVDEGSLDLFQMLAHTVDGRECLDQRHSAAIAQLSAQLARALGLDEQDAARVYLAGLVHDLGKIELAESLLRKPAALSRGEWREMASHPLRGAELVDRVAALPDVAWTVATHHERWDGIGYPFQLTGESIPLEARIVGAADALVSMTAPRSYRRPLTLPAALRTMLGQAGSAFDPAVVAGLLQLGLEGKLGAAVPGDHEPVRLSA